MRDVEVEMRMNEKEGDVVAYGTVTVDACIRFPLRIRKYVDKEDGKEKSFVSFPRRKTGDGWEDAVRPEPERREQIINAAWEAVKRDFSKDLNLPEVEEVDVTPLPDPYAGAARARIVGVATVSVISVSRFFLKQAVHKQTDITGKEMCFDAVLSPDIDRTCLKIRFHDPEVFFNFPTLPVDF